MKPYPLEENGFFKAKKQSKTIESIGFDLDKNKSLLVVNGQAFVNGNDYPREMINNIGYFENVLTLQDFKKEIVKNNKQDEIGSISDDLGLNRAYKKHRPFLYVYFKIREGKRKFPAVRYLQIIMLNPDNLEEIFIAETFMDNYLTGVGAENTYNPLFNELIKYIRLNSYYTND
ncbi:hypothetical protein BTO07_01840 [Polaribacter sp. SA4-12]|nr:hypothetical protein BTO07_01840 [Polaribacter sp. SA4-12]